MSSLGWYLSIICPPPWAQGGRAPLRGLSVSLRNGRPGGVMRKYPDQQWAHGSGVGRVRRTVPWKTERLELLRYLFVARRQRTS